MTSLALEPLERPPLVAPARVFFALLRRDLRVARREAAAVVVRVALQPLLFVTVFGALLPRMGFVQRSYGAALLPGILAISLAMSSIQSVALPMVADFGWTREIEDRLLAPVPIRLVALEKVAFGVLQGTIAALCVLPIARLIMGPIAGLTIANAGAVVTVAVLGAASFSLLGLLMGTAISPQQIGLMFSVIIAPMIFFGCAYYPWKGLAVAPVLQYVVLVNPLVYVSEGMRGALTPALPHMPLGVVIVALVVICAVCWYLGLKAFVRRAMAG